MTLPVRKTLRTALGGWGLLSLVLALGACAEVQALLPALDAGANAGRSPSPASSPAPGRSPSAQGGTQSLPGASPAPSSSSLPLPGASSAPAPSTAPTPTPEGADWPVVGEGETAVFGAGMVRWKVRKQGDRYGFWLSSNLHCELTTKLLPTLENLTESGAEPLVVVPPLSDAAPILASTWTVKDPSQPHRYDFKYRFYLGDYRVKPDPKTVYALPLPAGMTADLLQGWRGAFSHTGEQEYAVDFDLPEGTPVRASRAGVVVALNEDATTAGVDEAFKAAEKSNFVRVRHDDGSLGNYLHMQPQGVLVALGDRVEVGQEIARSGNTGYSSRPHLHFEVASPLDADNNRSFPFLWQVAAPPAAPEEPVEGQSYTGY